MRRTVIVVIFFAALLTGCNREPPVPATHSFDLFGGRYFVDIETVGSFAMSNNSKNGEQGGERFELAEYKWQGNTLRLDKGKLTFKDKDYGTLKEGDRVRVDRDGQLFINGKQQP